VSAGIEATAQIGVAAGTARCGPHGPAQGRVIVGGMTLAVPGATGFVALAQRAVIVMSGSCHRPGSGTLTGRPSAIQHSEGEHEEAPDQGRDHPGPGEHPVVARSGARDSGIQIRRPRDDLLAHGRSGAQLQGFAVVPPWS
jgi:hypothetical protein